MKEEVEAIQQEFSQLLSQRISLMMYCYLDLCTKADPVALLTLSARVKGAERNLEEVAQASLADDYSFCIIPFEERTLPAVVEGVMNVHPEWNPDIQLLTDRRLTSFDEATSEEIEKGKKVLVCTVPKTDKERRDLLVQSATAFYDKCKADMEKARTKYLQRQVETLQGATLQEIDEAKDKFDQLYDQCVKVRDDMKEKKVTEIEEAYQHYLAEKQAEDAQKQEEEAARGADKGFSMKFDLTDE